MTRFFSSILLTALLAFPAGLYLPWWSVAIAALLVALVIAQSPIKSFFSAFIGIFLLWLFIALWIDNKNDSILSQKIGELLGVGPSAITVALIASVVGALVAGFAGLTGAFIHPKISRSKS